MSQYYIPNYVHFAVEGEAVVFINIRADQYSMLLGTKARAFKSLVSSATGPINRIIRLGDPPLDEHAETLYAELLTDLLSNDLLTAATLSPPISVESPVPLPQQDLLEGDPPHSTPVRARDIWSFLISCATAKWRLSRTSIEHIVRALEHRKRVSASAPFLDLDEVRRLVRIYNRLRPLLPHDYLCLFDSLSLLEFLARYRCHPDLVFAVQLEPWAAHCWVQHDLIAFNEEVDTARTYLPLVAI